MRPTGHRDDQQQARLHVDDRLPYAAGGQAGGRATRAAATATEPVPLHPGARRYYAEPV